MVQSAKVIDVSKTFLPVDPNSFPENLLSAEGSDNYAEKVPVMAYDGYNFMPTNYGYKSYFGSNQNIGLDAIPARVDYVLLFQNTSLRNVLIAFTEIGIFTKPGNVGGAWTQNTSNLVPAVGTHYEWTYCVIDDILYAYRQGTTQYYEIKSNVLATVVDVTAKVPNFLNMAGQIGIFRAGGRLAFWDSEDSIGWSNLDDFIDFTPSIETLAGNAKFSDVVGKIVHIMPHGPGFIIYATKSIVYIAEDASATYQWNPAVVLNGSGITYPRNVCTSVPDTVHFAWTSSGLYKITSTKPEVIIPEVTDFLKEANDPIYLKVLEGRYLFIEILDPSYVNGYAQFSEEVVPPIDYVFPGSNGNLADIPDSYLFGQNICKVLSGIDNGNYTDQSDSVKGGLPGGIIPADKKSGTNMKPIWKCWLSNGTPMNADTITFGNTPCATVDPNGVERNFSPLNVAKVGDLTANSTNKRGVLGSDMYVDGIWTIERFVAVQSAIWEMEDQGREEVIKKILNKGASQTRVTTGASDQTTAEIKNECTIGRYPSAFSGPQFGYSACQFWLTRYAVAALDIIRVKVNKKNSVNTTPTPRPANKQVAFAYGTAGTTLYQGSNDADLLSQIQALMGPVFNVYLGGIPNCQAHGENARLVGSTIIFDCKVYNGASLIDNSIGVQYKAFTSWPGGTPVFIGNSVGTATANYCESGFSLSGSTCSWTGGVTWETTEQFNAYNDGRDVADFGVPGAVDTGYCEIIGFTYTANDNSTKTVNVSSGSCAAPSLTGGTPNNAPKPSGAKPGNVYNNILASASGAVCSIPFIPVVVPGAPATDVDWPTETVTIPQGSYLLQDGSIAPIYPLFFGALVYDLQLKKWGKMKTDYKALMDYSPINNAINGIITLDNFKMMAGILKSDGKIYLFDAYPNASKIVYGKAGYYRLGITSIEEVHVQFRKPSTGSMWVDGSLNGKSLSAGFTTTVNFANTLEASLYGGSSAKWHNITIEGLFDITYLEYRGFTAGRRTGR